ncbi:hypothetical protein LTR62_002125 [Meristemomyces frigidus]|uniref:F-box domain-containing protein n=1 Tax=Meristemomyces frigidus TaxID=1508187 RepID=A0AAN7TAI9_9PEZI|nr:hypothetical protein LTR62_002125 [Meristemomyces frigidus]
MPLRTTLRRISVTAALRRSSKTSIESTHIEPRANNHVRQEGIDGPGSGLLTLPTELLSQIFTTLSLDDICALRLTCRLANHLVSEGDILRTWMHVSSHVEPHLLRLYPYEHPIRFNYVIKQIRRQSIAKQTAALYTAFVYRNIVRVSLSRVGLHFSETKLRCDFAPVAAEMQARMVPLLLTLQHYMETCAVLTLKTYSSTCCDEGQVRSNLRDQATRALLKDYETAELKDMFKIWCFITWMSNQIFNRPSYAGAVERLARGWVFDSKLSTAELECALLYSGGLSVLRDALKCQTMKDRRAMLERKVKAMRPDGTGKWWEIWLTRDLAPPSKEVAIKVLLPETDHDIIFGLDVRTALSRAGVVECSEVHPIIGTVQQCTEFLTEMAGYDLLHRLPPEHSDTNTTADRSEDEDHSEREQCTVCERHGHKAENCPNANQ